MNAAYRRHLIVLCALVALALTPGVRVKTQQPLAPPAQDKEPFVGTWKANKDKSRPKLSDARAQYTWAYSREGDELIFKFVGGIKLTPYQSAHNEQRFRCDGERHAFGPPVQVAPPARAYSEGPRSGQSPPPVTVPSRDYLVCRFVSPNLIEGEQGHDLRSAGTEKPFFFGHVLYWTKEVSADGQQMITTTYADKARTKIQETFVLDRVN